MRIIIPALALFLGLSLGHSRAADTLEQSAPLKNAVHDADLIFEGSVESIEYRLSTAQRAGQPVLPLTYVTFQVAHVHKGSIDSGRSPNTLTLRFIGGPFGDGRYLRTSNGTEFNTGQRELLFVKNAASWGVPLVHSPARRLTIREDGLYTEQGNSLGKLAGNLVLRPAAGDPDYETGDGESVSAASPKDLAVSAIGQLGDRTGDKPFTLLDARTTIARVMQRMDARSATGKTVQSVDADQPFAIPAPTPTEPREN